MKVMSDLGKLMTNLLFCKIWDEFNSKCVACQLMVTTLHIVHKPYQLETLA